MTPQRNRNEKGTPTDPSDDTIVSTTIRDTALGYIFSGSWAHCWLEGGANTGTLVQSALDTWVPDCDLVLIILNDPRYGGCGGGGFQIVPLGVDWTVMAHEFGHGTGGLADEYCASPATYSGGEPGQLAIAAARSSVAGVDWAAGCAAGWGALPGRHGRRRIRVPSFRSADRATKRRPREHPEAGWQKATR